MSKAVCCDFGENGVRHMGSESRIVTRLSSRFRIAYGTCAISAVLAATLVLLKLNEPHEESDLVTRSLSYGYLSFEDSGRTSSIASVPAAQTGGLPSVPEIVGQLEDRLAREPEDAKGWSLLAMSYAYIGNTTGAEQAIANAVRLGLEENDVRSQVAMASNQRR